MCGHLAQLCTTCQSLPGMIDDVEPPESTSIQQGDFVARPTLRNGHWMTLYSWGNPRYFPQLPAPTRRYFDVAPGTRVAADCHWQPQPHDRPTLIALHGLNGSSDAHYMRG